MIATQDSNTFIEEISGNSTTYIDIKSGDRWIITGSCNHCGECVIGVEDKNIQWVDGKTIGEPDSFVYIGNFLDNPVRPEIKENSPSCTLSGRYLSNGH